jgi:hypothetical protein
MKVSEILQAQMNEFHKTEFVQSDQKHDFSLTLSRLSEEGLVARLTTLISDITVQGKRIAEHMDLGDLKRYRTMISDFFSEVVSHSHKYSRENYLDRRGRHRVYGIIKCVNKDLDDLAQELLNSEKDHIKILSIVDEINGLLLDVLM